MAEPVRLDAVCDELYGGPPVDFVRVRTERARQARAAGDRPLAAAIGRLRRPTQVAWAVNLLAREKSAEVAALLDLGAALRDAQRKLSAAELRSLSLRRQQLVRVMAAQAGRLADERGMPLGQGAIREVGQTLHAALADPDVGEQVRAGVLVTAATYDGFGPGGLTSVADRAESPTALELNPPESSSSTAAEPDLPSAADLAQAELAAADAALTAARTELADTTEQAAAVRERLTEIDSRIADLRELLDRTEQERQFVRSAERSATDTQRTAERAAERAERRMQRARDALDDLD